LLFSLLIGSSRGPSPASDALAERMRDHQSHGRP
jgi:hypothetical protein